MFRKSNSDDLLKAYALKELDLKGLKAGRRSTTSVQLRFIVP